jgi:hypothetical protein
MAQHRKRMNGAKDHVKQAIRLMMDILEKLDEIYHALHDKEEK